VAPASTRLARFQAPAAPLLPALLIFLSRAASLPRPAPSSARAAIATAAPPAKLAAGGPPLPAIEHTSLRLAPRQPVLAAGSQFEQGTTTLRVFAAVGHGAAVLISPWKGFPRPFSIPLSDLLGFAIFLRTQRARLLARSWLATAVGPLAAAAPPWRLEHQRGVAISPRPCWARSALGRSPEPGRRLSLRSVAQAESGCGPVVPMGRPSSNRKNVFGFSLLFGKINTLENVYVLILAPNLLKQILLGSLSPDLHDKNIACHF